ncbi:hypothetical protein [Corallococcus terminator]|nr:hypothetical protein [Corallococcus terminator]
MRVWMVGLGLVLVAGVARGGWTVTQTQNGVPSDVTVFRPGHFAVATGEQLFISRDGGISALSGEMAGSFLQGSDCVVGILSDSTLQSVAGCSPDEGKSLFPTANDYTLRAVRLTADGGVGYAAATPFPSGGEFRSSFLPKEGTAQWGLLTMPQPGAVPLAPLAVLPPQPGGVPHALYSVSSTVATLVWYRGATGQTFLAPGSPPVASPLSMALLPGLTPAKPLAFFGNNSALFRGTLEGTSWPFDPVLTGAGSVDALAFDVANGSAAGVGFGLMLAKKDGRVRAYSAEPVSPSSLPGSVWRENTSFPTGITQTGVQMSCWGASYCVAVLNGPVQNILIYQNEKTPDLRIAPDSLDVEEGRTTSLILNPRDGDGDAVRVTFTPRDPNGLLSIQSGPPPAGDNGMTLSLTADSGFCASQQASLDVVASDGLAAHDTTKTVELNVKHTIPPAAPLDVTVNVPGGVFFAGGAAGTLTPVRGASGCEPVRYPWAPAPTRAPKLDVTDRVATLNPVLDKADRCKPVSTVFTYTVRANDGELDSAPRSVPVEFHPWGPPEAPFPNPPMPRFTGESLQPQSLHLCAPNADLPLVKTFWSRLDASPVVAVNAVQAQGAPQPPVGTTPVEGTAVVVDSQGACSDASVTLRAFNQLVVDGHLLVGPESIVDVTVKPRWVPMKNVTPVLTLDPPEERKVRGRLVTPALNCVSSRGITTVVTLESSDASAQVLATQSFPGASGDIALDLPPTCGSATYNVRVRVQEPVAGGATETSESLQSLTRDARDVELGDVDGELVATCEDGARGTLRQTFPAGACTAVNLDWTYVRGPELETPVSAGDSATLSTKDKQLESLVGEFVTVNVAATGEGASAATREHSVRIGARPFVSLERRAETGPGSDSSQVGVSVFLHNDTGCGVSAIRYEEIPSGAEVVLDSVRLNGQPVIATALEGGGFAVEPVPLEGGATAALTYVIRPAFLGEPTFSGTATLRGIVVSRTEAPPPSTSGCGCSGSGSGVTAFGLGALAWMARRRRGVRARS